LEIGQGDRSQFYDNATAAVERSFEPAHPRQYFDLGGRTMSPLEDSDAGVRHLLRGAAPERASEMESLWDRYAPAVELAVSSAGITMNATSRRIRFDTKTLDVLWLIGFSGWRSIETYAPGIVLAGITGTSLEDALKNDEDLGLFEAEYKQRIRAAHAVLGAKSTSDVPWPPDIPEPQGDRNALASEQDKVAFDLVGLATAFVFLHEFRHVMFRSEGTAPSERFEEEVACDVWARTFLTEKHAIYAQAAGYDARSVLTKRSMAMALGALILYEITPEQSRRGGANYPHIANRIQSLIGGTQLADDSNFWLFASCLLVGVIRQSHRSLQIVPSSGRMLVEQLIQEVQ
jgi:Peptidase U49